MNCHFRPLVLACLLVLLWPLSVAGHEPDDRLVQIRQQLRHVLREIDNEVTYRFDDAGSPLVIEYRTRAFLIHARTKSGEISREAHETRGPSHDGFLMRVHLQDAGTVNQAMVPQTIREPYWMTSLDVIPLDQEKQVYVAISFGSRVDETIAAKLAEFWNERKQSATSVVKPEASQTETDDTLEGTLRRHPKFAYRFYLDGFVDGQSCGLEGMDELLENVAVGSRLRVHGRLVSRHIAASDDGTAALAPGHYIVMQVGSFEVLAAPSRHEAEPK